MLLLVQEPPPLLALQKVVAVHRLLAQVHLPSYSDWQLHFATYTIDMRQLCQHRPSWLLLTPLPQLALELVQVTLQILQLQ